MPWRRSLAAGWIEMRQQDPAGDRLSNRYGQEFYPRAINAVLGFCGLLSHTSKRMNVLRPRNRTAAMLQTTFYLINTNAGCCNVPWNTMGGDADCSLGNSSIETLRISDRLSLLLLSLFTNKSFITAFPPADTTKCNTRCALGSYQRDK